MNFSVQNITRINKQVICEEITIGKKLTKFHFIINITKNYIQGNICIKEKI